MAPIFDKERKHRCDGKTIVITGANVGIGFETAKELLIRGGRVIILCRNEEKMLTAKEELQKSATGEASIDGILMDLKNFESVRKAAGELRKLVDHIDILILNAGIMKVPLEFCEGLESEQCTNHFSHFLFLNLIIDLVKKAPGKPRVISLSSGAHNFAPKNPELYWCRYKDEAEYKASGCEDSMAWSPYGASKLANLLHMRHAARLAPEISFYSVHPGMVKTELGRYWRNEAPWFFFFTGPILNLFTKSTVEGAQTSLYCSLAPELNEEKYNGKYFADCALTDPDKRYAYGKQEADLLAETLWKSSEEITNSKFLSL